MEGESDLHENMSENEEPGQIKSYELINNQLLSDALRKDKGEDAELLSWEAKPFTNKGDNYLSIVAGLTGSYRKNEVISEYSYVAKLNPLRPVNPFTNTMEKGYIRETEMLSEVVEGMNKQLERLGLDRIKTPKLFAKNLDKGREAYVTENLRIQGFKMYDRMKGMDFNHSIFVVKELGKFHASSLLFEESLPTKSIPETFNALKRPWIDIEEEEKEVFSIMFSACGEAAGKFLRNSDPKYKKCSNWLLKNAHTLVEHYINGFKPWNNFDVLIHGDFWTNNMLFRYNEDEIPVEFRFLDLQYSGKASATSDLNYFFFTSINGDFRRENFNTLVTAYYESFFYVLKRAKKEPPFSYLELKQELNDRKIFGMVSAMFDLQFILSEGEEVPDLENWTEENFEEFVENQMKTFEKMSKRDGPFRDRYMAIFDDMLETTCFEEN